LERGQYDVRSKIDETGRDGTGRNETSRDESSRVESSRSIDRPTTPVRDPPLTEVYNTGACVEKRSLSRGPNRVVDKKEERERMEEGRAQRRT